jgi:DNA-binding LytR/AlgR family response regulator
MMALADDWGSVAMVTRMDRVRFLLTTSLIWVGAVVLFSIASWIDARSIQPAETAYLPYMQGWATGMLPWIILVPLVFRLGARATNAALIPTLRSAIAAGLVSMLVVAVYASLVWSAGTERSPLEVLASFKLKDWLWDIVFYVVAFLAGRQMRPGADHRSPAPMAANIAVKSVGRVDYIPIRDILAATAQGNYIALHLADRDVLHRSTMAKLSEALADAGFVRIHRSHIVNPARVTSTGARGDRVHQIELSNGLKLPVSDRYKPDVRHHLSDRVCA